MKIKEHPLYIQYIFSTSLIIDDELNVSLQDTSEFDAFRLCLEKHNIWNFKMDRTVNAINEIEISIILYNELITPSFEYDLSTLMLEGKLGK